MDQTEKAPEPEKRPETLYEAASYDLNKFRERRMADRRFTARNSPDRRASYRKGQEGESKPDLH
ncbi:MAG: hypothetical protein ACO1N5_10470 [Noviherbaspirillum sp.]